MLFGNFGRMIAQINLVEADIVGVILEVLVRHFERFLHQLVKRLLRIFEKFGIAPAEDGAVAALGGRGKEPFRLKAFIRFRTH